MDQSFSGDVIGMIKTAGILTWHYYQNFGSALQAYALQRALKRFGVKASIINYRNPKFGTVSFVKENIKYLLSVTAGQLPGKIGRHFTYSFISFQKTFLNQTRVVYDPIKLGTLLKNSDAIICGSDQIWAPNVFNPVYMASFTDSRKIRKISYAASIGLNEVPEKTADEYKKLLSDFKAISVREEAGQKLLVDNCGIDSTVVLDPTLLLDVSDYKKIQRKTCVKTKPFIFCYFLNVSHKYRQVVEKYAEEKNLDIIGVSAKKDDGDWMNIQNGIGPREFLYFIDKAHTVFTDSYHGTIFSLLYHKNFYTFERFSADDPICQNSRIYQLDKYFDIKSRIIVPKTALSEAMPVNYGEFEEKLIVLRKKSFDFLEEALK